MYLDTLKLALRRHYDEEFRDGIHVTDLTLCPRKTVFRRIEKTPITEEELGFFTRGRAVHEAIQILTGQDQERFEMEKKVTYNLVQGHVDIYDKIDNVPIEFKSSNVGNLEKPYSFHEQQLKHYMAILNADRGVILYFFLQNKNGQHFKEFEITMTPQERLDQLQKMIVQAALQNEALISGDPHIAHAILNNPDLNFQCQKCPYKKQCWESEGK